MRNCLYPQPLWQAQSVEHRYLNDDVDQAADDDDDDGEGYGGWW